MSTNTAENNKEREKFFFADKEGHHKYDNTCIYILDFKCLCYYDEETHSSCVQNYLSQVSLEGSKWFAVNESGKFEFILLQMCQENSKCYVRQYVNVKHTLIKHMCDC